uniref:Putative u5 snrnp-associated rna splicing factor n=1 Tax=Ixodes ricinus TaxID=34613 RepID=A0A0K8R481_IXORI
MELKAHCRMLLSACAQIQLFRAMVVKQAVTHKWVARPARCPHVATQNRVRHALYSTEREGSVGKSRWHCVMSRLRAWMNLRCVSSLRTWAMFWEKIFSRPVRAWMPTMVTPMGHGALPMAICR